MRKLTNKQAKFVREYLVDLNATQAAIRAGYSKKTSHVIGHENLNKPEIATAIAKAMDEQTKRTEITTEMVLEGLLREATNLEAKPGERTTAWSWLGKYRALFTEKHQVTGELPSIKFELADDGD